MAGLSLSLFGEFEATLDEQPIEVFRTRLAQALLIYLAVEPQRHRREQLMALFWPDLPQASAQQNLRQNLYLLRQAIGDVDANAGGDPVPLVLSDREYVQLNPAALVSVDARRVDEILDQIHPVSADLQEVVSLYAGDFLADFYLPFGGPFDEWSQARREAYRRDVLELLARLVQLAFDSGDYALAETYVRQQLAIDPLQEAANRRLMEILARSDRRIAAVTHFDAYSQILQRDLDLTPGPETLSLMDLIRTGDLSRQPIERHRVRGYETIDELGRTSYAVVYRALQTAVGRDVALKIITARYADNADFIRRFESEARMIAKLEHPNIVPLYDYWREPGGAYLVMRYFRGGDLRKALADHYLSAEDAGKLADQMAAALYEAHTKGIVHCDVKPGNILLDDAGNAYLADFGIASLLQPTSEAGSPDLFLGTPDYLSPEQARMESVTPFSDQYSLGMVMYEALTGKRPFETNSMAELFQKHLTEPLPDVRLERPELSAAVDDVLQQATAKVAADRFPDMIAFANAFRAALLPTGGNLAGEEPTLPLQNPYMGLLPFDEADAMFFFGRRAMTAQLIKRLQEDDPYGRFLAIVGPSGSGKSSLARAGLVPALRKNALPGSSDWFIVEMTVGSRPFDELAAALERVAVYSPTDLAARLRNDSTGLRNEVREMAPANKSDALVLVIDQFEELFTQSDDPVQIGAFLNSLYVAVMDPECPIRVIITLRADFYDRPLLYAPFSDLIRERTEVVVPLTTEELTEAIARPAARVGVTVEPELIASLVSDVNGQPGALPLLQYTLSELFERRDDDEMTAADYEAIGGIQGALSLRAESVYDDLSPTEQRAARVMFSRLVTVGTESDVTKRRVLLAELQSLDDAILNEVPVDASLSTTADPSSGGEITIEPSPVEAVIAAFGAARLLSFDRDRASRSPTVEIAHEALLGAWPRLAIWLDVDRATIRLERVLSQATADWLAAGQDAGFLLRGARLDQLGTLAASDIALTHEEKEFLRQSLVARSDRLAAEEARHQQELALAQSLARTETQRAEDQARDASRLRALAAVLAVVGLMAAGAALLAYNFARDSDQNAALAVERELDAVSSARLATSRELSQAASNTLDIDPELSMLLALQALDQTDSKEAREALHQALQADRNLSSFNTDAQGQFGSLFATSPDGRLVATAGDEQVTIWDAPTGTALIAMPLAIPTTHHYAAAFSEDGSRLALVSADPSLGELMFQTWEVEKGNPIMEQHFPIALTDSADVALSPDWSMLAVGFEDSHVELWDVVGMDQLMTVTEHTDAVIDTEFSGSGSLLLTAGRDGIVNMWDLEASLAEGLPIRATTIDGSASTLQLGGLVHTEVISDTGVALGYLGGIEVWALDDNSRPKFTLQGNTKLSRDFAISDDLSKLAAGLQDGTGQVWDLNSGNHLLTLAQHPSPVDDLAFSPDSRQAITLDRDGLLRVWDTRLTRIGERSALSVDPGMFDIEISPDGQYLAEGNAGGPASIWSLATGGVLHRFPGDFGGVYRVAFSPDGVRLAAAGSDGKVRIWDSLSGRLMATLEGHGQGLAADLFPGVMDVTYSPDGTRLATAGADGLAIIWDAVTGTQLMQLAGHTDSLLSLAWSPDGRTIATTSDDQDTSVRLWDAQTGELLQTLLGHVVRAWGVSFSPDSKTLITGGARGIIKAWDVATGRNLYTVVDEADHIGHITFTPDGQRFISSGEVPLRIRRTSEGEEELTLAQSLMFSTRVSSDGRWIYAGDAEGVVPVYAINIEDAVQLATDKLTRWWRPEECLRYLHTEVCPTQPVN